MTLEQQTAELTQAYQPMTLGPITLPNRFIKAGANENMSLRGLPTQALVKHHAELARGGVGLTTVAYLSVTKDGRTLPDQLWLSEDAVPALRVVTDAVHEAGGKIAAQITHGGSFVTGIFQPRRLLSSMSGFNAAGLLRGNVLRRAMNKRDMDRMVDHFVAGAVKCMEAGFDAVEIHMGHGYLLNQFLSPMDNQRKDQYGGSAENRARFPVRVLREVKAAVGHKMAVLAKINVADGRRSGATVDDAIVTAKLLEEAGADMLVLSGGRNVESGWFMFGSNMNLEAMQRVLGRWSLSGMAIGATAKTAPKVTFKELYFWEYSKKIRAAVTVPLAYLGGVKTADNVAQCMGEGFDAVVIARALLREPELVNKWRDHPQEASLCDNCNSCIAYIYHPAGTWCIHRPPNSLEDNQTIASSA
jgi:2,4-dienoyl-CoA reductase-like NADH-dependent reductase (Old Yellow Enzyme family)